MRAGAAQGSWKTQRRVRVRQSDVERLRAVQQPWLPAMPRHPAHSALPASAGVNPGFGPSSSTDAT